MEDIVINISLNDNGDIIVEPETVELYCGQNITWVGSHDFKVEFPLKTPLLKKSINCRGTKRINGIISKKLKRKLKRKRYTNIPYKYDIHMDGKILDPHLIIIDF